jgi:hypothetical protein
MVREKKAALQKEKKKEKRKTNTALATSEWTTLNPRGRAPDPRSFHTATRIAGGVLVFGGMSVNNSHFSDVHVLTHFGMDDKPLSWLQPSGTGMKFIYFFLSLPSPVFL